MLRTLPLIITAALLAGLSCGDTSPLHAVGTDAGAGGGVGTVMGGGTGNPTGGGDGVAAGGGTGDDGGAGTGGGVAAGGGSGLDGGAVTPDGGTGGGMQSPPDAGTAVRFIAIGDTGKGNAGQNQVGQTIGTFCAANGCDFVVLLGDNFYPTGVGSTTDPQWETAFVQPYATVNAPFYAVLGNHDYGGNGSGTELAKGDNEVAYALVNPKWRMPAHDYTFNYGNTDFFVADTNRSMFSLDTQVRDDFAQWIPASTATWKVAFGHHPYLSNGEHGNAGNYDGLALVPVANGAGVKSFLDDRVCGKVDFYISGHDHSIQYLRGSCGATPTQLIVSGGGAATTALPGSQQVWYSSDALGFVYVVIDGRTFTASFYDATGTLKYTRTTTK